MEAMQERIPPKVGTGPRKDPAARRSLRRVFADLAKGRKEALGDLYEIVSGRLYGLALWRTGSPDDASEVVQELFVRVAERGKRLSNVRDPESWLLTVAHRLAVDATRRRRRRAEESIDSCPFLVAEDADVDRALDAGRASTLLAQLPPAQREAIYLHHFAGRTFEAIGRITGVPTFTAASRYRLGLEKMRRLMEATR
jgi:RNA polymerase sigma-70 factor (ECF subfamily)